MSQVSVALFSPFLIYFLSFFLLYLYRHNYQTLLICLKEYDLKVFEVKTSLGVLSKNFVGIELD
jgi:hypothetical protein